ncbi:Transcriptional regulatory protein DegU [Pseudobythopirellula maris]|uniref:Transcriptional regulatory protein DegU n=1 Tax=Pseudobythopirellula maris TaxID=2527991 RepID=A0A5C5ZKK7_9BACT|nr:response regulator transcription factor [Pseudobythopirellula maris]TWT87577.1 Transcriptional regulatory protein DegU [Pseudobythopirellula maris]
MSHRVVIADDHPAIRVGVRSALANEAWEIVGEACDGEEAYGLVSQLQPDILLTDVRMAPVDGLDCLARMRASGLRTPVLVYTGYDNPTYVARAHALGAAGFLLKTVSLDELRSAMLTVASGGACWTKGEMRRLTGALAAERLEGSDGAPLTRRESEVLKQLAHGLSNKEIALALGISYETVKEHVQHILRKIGVSDRTQAAVWAVRRDLV